jgi:hypothetical protein
MFHIAKSVLLPFGAVLLLAADPSGNTPAWKTKDISQWNEQEAKLLLADSPWVKKTTPAPLPPQNEASRRQGGQWGGGQGTGVDSLSAASLFGGGSQQPGKRRAKLNQVDPVEVRWESARPVRAAELKAHDTDAPDWEGSFYVVAVYDVPGLDINAKALPGALKQESSLELDGKKPLKPVRVDLLPQVGNLTTVVYLFPRSMEITLEDKQVEFRAMFGRLFIAQYFYTEQMRFQGKLEL